MGALQTGMPEDPTRHSPVPMDSDEASLWQRLREHGDPQARQALLQRYLPYARVVAASYYARRMHDEIEFAEYLQLAHLGMIESLDRYDPAQGAQFKTFAARRMHGAILDGLERLTEKQQQIAARQRVRQERLQALKQEAQTGRPASRRGAAGDELFRYLAEVGVGLALGILLEDTGMVEPAAFGLQAGHAQHSYHHVELAQLRRRVAELVGQLPVQQRTVVQRHYLQEHSFDDIAQQLGLTKGRISQIHKQALESLRQLLGPQGACDLAL